MFDLDQAIARWRRQLAQGGIGSPHLLDELEGHLRDDLEAALDAGADSESAFHNAVQHLGQVNSLEPEFKKVGLSRRGQDQFKHFALTLAGIQSDHPMNDTRSSSEPFWVTYAKATTFITPAIFLWVLSLIFLIPKLQQICSIADGRPLPVFIQLLIFVSRNGFWAVAALLLSVVLLEWRCPPWPRYRRVTVGAGAFLLNAIVLIAIFMMVVLLVTLAPDLARR